MVPQRCFVWRHNPNVPGDNNDGELQDLLDAGWTLEAMTNAVVSDGMAATFMTLFKPKDEDDSDDDDEDSQLDDS